MLIKTFGLVTLSLVSLASLVSANVLKRATGGCGSSNGGVSCASGLCCSQYGYCGSTSDYCGTGCQKGYGTCGPATTPTYTTNGPLPTGSPAKIIDSCKASKAMALTFDDGPYHWMSNIVDQITKYNSTSKVTFFVNGNNYACIYDPDIVANITYAFNHGFQIGMHTWTHPYMSQLTVTQMRYQIEYLETALLKILGVVPRYFRMPYGDYNQEVLNVLGDYGLQPVLWSDDSGDSDGASVASQKKTYDAIFRTKTSHIVLNHETYQSTVTQTLPYVLGKLGTTYRNFTVQTVGECIGNYRGQKLSDWYKVVQKPGTRDSTWTCDNTPQPGDNPPPPAGS